MAKIRIAQLQLPVPEDKTDTMDLVRRTVGEVVSQKVDMVFLAEMFCCPYQAKNFPLYAEEEGGPMWRFCSGLAKEHGIWLSAGSMPERDEAGHIYNTAYVFDRSGRQVARHRKMHLFDIDVKGGQRFMESETLTAGDSVTTFETEFGTFGLCVCYDFRFPEIGRLMALRGAQVIVVPAAFNMTTGPAHWEIMFRSQAVNNQVFAVGTAPSRDPSASYTSWAHSIVVDPWGRVVNMMDEAEGVYVGELDLSTVQEIRDQLPLLKHRRTDVYRLEEKERKREPYL